MESEGDPAYSPTACPFCTVTSAPAEVTAVLRCPLWRCACGAVGVGASPMDVDEALDELEVTLGLPGGVLGAPATVPIGTSGMLHAAYIDPPALVAAAVAAAPPGWRVGSSRATLPVRGRGEPPEVRLWELIVVWAARTPPTA